MGWVALNVYSFAYSVRGGVIDAALFWIWERRCFTPQHTKIVIDIYRIYMEIVIRQILDIYYGDLYQVLWRLNHVKSSLVSHGVSEAQPLT